MGGMGWLFLGVANSDALLYDDEWQPIVKNFPDNFKLDYALSREQKNKAGGKMYIQDKVGEYADEVFKGMMPGILEMLDGVSKEKGIVWEDKLKEWKKNGQSRRGVLNSGRDRLGAWCNAAACPGPTCACRSRLVQIRHSLLMIMLLCVGGARWLEYYIGSVDSTSPLPSSVIR